MHSLTRLQDLKHGYEIVWPYCVTYSSSF